jgi:branched-subunit amino acid ABC-type transport system permease component
MVDIYAFLQTVITGLATGSLIGLGAVGLTLSYGVTRFINLAYGEFLTYAAFTTLGFTLVGLSLPVSGVLAVVVVGGFGVVLARVFFRPFREAGSVPLLIVSLGVGYAVRSLLGIFVGSTEYSYGRPVAAPLTIGELYISKINLLIIGCAVALMFGIHVLLQHTATGRRMRATSGNRELAEISGIDIDGVIRKTWFISSALGALAGIFLAITFPPFRVVLGWLFMPMIFAATLLGGIGRPYGAMLGGLIVGELMSFGTYYVSSSYTRVYAFAVLILVLLFRPEGLFRGEEV